MNRVKHGALLALAAATLASGCTTFSDNDAVARVDDVELSSDELASRIGAPGDVAVDADEARGQINAWISEQLPVPDGYNLGFEAGLVCSRALVAQDAASGAAAVDQLIDGQDFAEVFAALNVNEQLAQAGGVLGCAGPQDITPGSGDQLADMLSQLNATNDVGSVPLPIDPSQPELTVVAQFIPYGELSAQDAGAVNGVFPQDISGLDIYIDPRYGTFDPDFGAVPLG